MRTLIPAVTMAVVVALAAGCGSSSDKSSKSDTGAAVSGKTITISMKDFSLTPSDVTISAPGTYTINATNDGGTSHAIKIEGNGLDQSGEVVGPGGTSTIKVDIEKAGDYELYCPVGNHKDLGMKGTLTLSS